MSNTVLDSLLSRRSVKLLGLPGPSDEQLEAALSAVARAPDHAKLRVWQFVVIKQPDIVTVGEKAIAIQSDLGSPVPEAKQASTRAWLADVPLLIGLANKIHHDHPKVPEIEQTLSMGAGVMNFQNAMHAMGFASYWSTGLASFTEEMAEYLGFDTLEDQFVGFLAVGTPKNTIVPAERVDPWSIVRPWQAP
jgi:nitroreductase